MGSPDDDAPDTLHDPAMEATLAATAGADPRALAAAPTQLPDTLSAPARAVPQDAGSSLPGYQLGAQIGSGGMGEVVLGLDHEIGREVAIKRLRADRDSAVAVGRFLREAKIQARLEHPAIVPVHALGRDHAGNPFFTMKRLVGQTLEERLRSEPPPSLQELLRALVDVCRAIELAHANGVIHRDLKPANIMLGNFGEVYVLDWGIARVLEDRPSEAVARDGDIDTLDGLTQAGALFGTPGYMAPEQVDGSPDVGTPADVYALGSILFEILAGESLHPRGNKAALASMLAGEADPSPARRRPERPIPPELDELCIAALALAPRDRPAVRAFADDIQRYLDGDRDHERRRQLATTELEAAERALASGDLAQRALAIRAAGRALALDPESRDAATLITTLMLEPPKQHPPALAAALAVSDTRVQQRQGKLAVPTLFAVLLFLGAAAANGVRDLPLLLGIAGWASLLAFLAWSASRHAAKPVEMWMVAIGNAVLSALFTRMFGPLIVAPIVTCVMAVSLTSYPQLMYRARIVIGLLLASWLLPVLLERTGVLAATWSVEHGRVISTSSVIQIEGAATTALLIGANVLAITVIGLFANALARSRHAAQRDVEIQAWQLRQLLPDE
jgi:serine/threonine-protein kinase